jgi:hypothetical protein
MARVAAVVAPARRVQTCPAAAICAVNAGSSREAGALVPAWLRTECARICAGRDVRCPEPVGARLERWLCSTRGSELRKAKTLDAALRCVAHVACKWDTEAGEDEDGSSADATRRPAQPPRLTTQLVLPMGLAAGHLIGRRGSFLKPMLFANPSVRVRFEGTFVRIDGVPGEVGRVHHLLYARAETELSIQCERRAMIQAQQHRVAASQEPDDLMYCLAMEREYRERNMRRRAGRPHACQRRVTRLPRKGKALPPSCLAWEHLPSQARTALHDAILDKDLCPV